MRILRKATASQRNRLRIVSIVLVFTVVFSLFFLPCYYYVRKVTRANVLESHQRKMDIAMRTFNLSVNALGMMDDLIFEEMDYRSLLYPDGIPNDQQMDGLRSLMHTYLQPYDMIADAGVVRDQVILLTRYFLYYQRNELAYQNYFRPEKTDFFQQMTGAKCVLPAMKFTTSSYGEYNAFTIAFRWSGINRMYAFATWPVDRLASYFMDEEALQTGSFSLYAGDALILSKGSRPENGFERLTASGDNSITIF